MRKNSTKILVLMALFASISIVLRFCVIYFGPTIRIGFGNLPVLLSSLFLGAGPGALVGAVSDIVYAMFSGLGWQPLITIGPILAGVLPALLKPFLLKSFTAARLYAVLFLTELASSIIWTTACLSLLYGTSYLALLAARGPIALLTSVINTLVIYLLYPKLEHMLKRM